MVTASTALACVFLGFSAADLHVDGWSTDAPRAEICPNFAVDSDASAGLNLVLRIASSGHEAVDGAWVKVFPVEGGRWYRFSSLRQTVAVTTPRRSAVVRLIWQDAEGNLVPARDGELARPEYPTDGRTCRSGWVEVAGNYQAPKAAVRARVELRLRWTLGSVRWRNLAFRESSPVSPRLVRLAAVHSRPRDGKTNLENCRHFAPLIAEAASQGANLICLPESITYCGTARSLAACAEPIPGPSTEYFGQLAVKHKVHLVAGLTERAGPVIYNTAALIGPDGSLIGKYRKVCLPREEIEAGLTPGTEYPVFDVAWGKLGLMICWDVQFPEVARNLSQQGAEVIAMPIWGGSRTLAEARAIENQVYLVSSTYTSFSDQGMLSAVWDRQGKLLASNGSDADQVAVAEVDLNARTIWPWLGDLRARIPRERPAPTP